MTKWVYCTEFLSLTHFTDEHFNALGEEGWELVTLKIDNNSRFFQAVFKKPKPEDTPGKQRA
jgi:hypothetical protein